MQMYNIMIMGLHFNLNIENKHCALFDFYFCELNYFKVFTSS
jgi:hypothetical protein